MLAATLGAAGAAFGTSHAAHHKALRWYAENSPWNEPIPAGPRVLASSIAWAEALQKSVGQIGINTRAWTPGVFGASAKAPRQTVLLDGGWAIDGVPIPPNLAPSNDTDAHALIVDARHNREYDFWRLRRESDGSWRAAAGVVFRLKGSGWWKPDPWGARASSAALGGGLIRPYEVLAGRIEHALSCTAPRWLIRKLSYGAASPATTSDGTAGGEGIPMGTRFQLDPSLDLDALGLDAGQRLIARALQTYGMYIVDSSGGVVCYAASVHGYSQTQDPYPRSWDRGLPGELLGRLRAIAPPRSVTWDSRAVLGQPHRQ